MARFIIAGKPDCAHFVHAIHVAAYLTEHLPFFTVYKIEKKTGDFEPWLCETNKKYGWHHPNSPVIWKEISLRGGKAHKLGGLSEFWEYCCDYYKLESIIPREDLEKLVADNLAFFNQMEMEQNERFKKIKKVTISGSTNPLIITLLPELLEMEELQIPYGLAIRLFDRDLDIVENENFLVHLVEEHESLAVNGDLETIKIVDTYRDAITDCEIYIIIDDFSRKPDEEYDDWLVRNMTYMFQLADEINVFAHRSLKIILAHPGSVCFNAALLMEVCTTIRICNIIAITADLGLGPLKAVSEETNVPVSELGAAPVWGFIGMNQFIDVDSIIKHSNVYRPYLRAVKNIDGSTLPQGIIQPELRLMAYLTKKSERMLQTASQRQMVIESELGRPPVFAKVRSLVKLLKLWCAKEPSDDIISLGICSDGSFGIPNGLMFSQPSILIEKFWVPFRNFPLNEHSKTKIKELLPPTFELLEQFDIGPKFIEFS